MIVIVTGGRTYTMQPYDWLRLDQLDASALYEGEADGADICGRAWAESRRVPVRPFKVEREEWAEFGDSAGPRRNAKMLAAALLEAERTGDRVALAAFPGGSGTADMVRRADARREARPVLLVLDWRRFVADEARQAHAAAHLRAAGRALPADHWSAYRRPEPRHYALTGQAVRR